MRYSDATHAGNTRHSEGRHVLVTSRGMWPATALGFPTQEMDAAGQDQEALLTA